MQSVQFGAVYGSTSKTKARGRALTEMGRGEKVVIRPHWQIDITKTLGAGQPRFFRQWLVGTGKEADIMGRTKYSEDGPAIQSTDQLLEKLGLSAKLKLDNIINAARKPGQGLGQLLGSVLSQGGAGLKEMLSGVSMLADIQGSIKKLGDPAELPVDTDLDAQVLLTVLAFQSRSLDKPAGKLP